MVTAKEIADFVPALIVGDLHAPADALASIHSAGRCTLSWLRQERHVPAGWNGSILLIAKTRTYGARPRNANAFVLCDNPRLAFARVAAEFFDMGIDADADVVRLADPTCKPRIHPSAVVGARGAGYVDDGVSWVEMPQIGGVLIHPGVHIGANATIMRGALDDTEIGGGTKIGNGANIGHGAMIGAYCMIGVHATIGGSACLGDRVRVWMGAMVGHGVKIGRGATIGMGAVVLDDVPPGETWAGNPARRIKPC